MIPSDGSFSDTRPRGGAATRWLRTFVVSLLAAATLVALETTPSSAISGRVPLPPAGKTYFGTYTPPAGTWTADSQKNAYLNLERQLGRSLDIAQIFYGWSSPFPTWWETWQSSGGRIPLLAWAGYNTDSVANGSQDAVIRARADALRAFGRPVFLRWLSEMDGSANRTIVRSPSSFISAWRHIYSVFQSRGATNVSFVWCPTAWGFVSGQAAQYYPGSAYVDWVCTDGYNWAPGRAGDKWRSFTQIFQAFYDWGMTTGKPLMLAEYGCQEGASGQKAAWFNGARNDLRTRFPGIRAVVYFDTLRTYNWRVATSSSSLNAFKAMGLDTHFNF